MRNVICLMLVAASSTFANASVITSYQFSGKGNWSIDAVGSNSTPVGTLSAIVPVGSIVEKAFLYSSKTPFDVSAPTVDFNGTIYGPAAFTALGTSVGGQAFRADITAQIAGLVGGGSAVPFLFTVNSETVNSDTDGEGLVIVYSNPAESQRTIAVLDGFSVAAGDMTTVNLLTPITAADLLNPSFEAIMSLGIGFSAQSNQTSNVDIDGQRLTSSAGGQDDGILANGGLITFGGIGDSIANPIDPLSTGGGDPRYDDELYNLKPFLTAGATSIAIKTQNPSNDDNIFFLGINITKEATINTTIPEPTSVAVWSIAVCLGLVQFRPRRTSMG